MAEEFWKAESGWVLLRVDDGLLPFNQETRVAKLIDDDPFGQLAPATPAECRVTVELHPVSSLDWGA